MCITSPREENIRWMASGEENWAWGEKGVGKKTFTNILSHVKELPINTNRKHSWYSVTNIAA